LFLPVKDFGAVVESVDGEQKPGWDFGLQHALSIPPLHSVPEPCYLLSSGRLDSRSGGIDFFSSDVRLSILRRDFDQTMLALSSTSFFVIPGLAQILNKTKYVE